MNWDKANRKCAMYHPSIIYRDSVLLLLLLWIFWIFAPNCTSIILIYPPDSIRSIVERYAHLHFSFYFGTMPFHIHIGCTSSQAHLLIHHRIPVQDAIVNLFTNGKNASRAELVEVLSALSWNVFRTVSDWWYFSNDSMLKMHEHSPAFHHIHCERLCDRWVSVCCACDIP